MVHLSRVTGKGPGYYALVCVLCCPVSRRRKNGVHRVGSTAFPLAPSQYQQTQWAVGYPRRHPCQGPPRGLASGKGWL